MSIQGDPSGEAVFQQGGGHIINSIYDVSPTFLGDLAAYFTQNPFPIPFTQITGMEQFQPQPPTQVAATVTTTSTTYVALSGGPTVSSLAPGLYQITFGAEMFGPNGQRMTVQIDGAAVDPNTTNYCNWDSTAHGTPNYTFQAQVTSTITCMYRSSIGGTVNFLNRQLQVQKVNVGFTA